MAGTFFGYREKPGPVYSPRRLRPQGSISPMKLSPLLMESIAIPGYDYSSANGMAPEDFGSWIALPWQCRMAKWTLRGGPMEVQVSYDGVIVGDQRTLRASTTTLDSFVAYRVRELVPGFHVWYQLIAII